MKTKAIRRLKGLEISTAIDKMMSSSEDNIERWLGLLYPCVRNIEAVRMSIDVLDREIHNLIQERQVIDEKISLKQESQKKLQRSFLEKWAHLSEFDHFATRVGFVQS